MWVFAISAIIFASTAILVLERVLPTSIGPQVRRVYVAKNLVKSAALLALTPSAFAVVLGDAGAGADVDATKAISSVALARLGIAYGATDVAALLFFQKCLSRTTALHHSVVALFMSLVASKRFVFDGTALPRSLVTFTAYSTLAFPVNVFLALRIVFYRGRRGRGCMMRCFKNLCAIVYAASISANAYAQCTLWRSDGAESPPWWYVLLLCFILYDDVVLLRFLCRSRRSP
jgi:hypothetical protein